MRSRRTRDAVRPCFRTLCRLAAAIVLAGFAGLAGCAPKEPEPVQEILPKEDLLSHYNARAEAIQKLRAKCHVEARLPKLDDEGRPIEGEHETWSLDGNLLLRKPRDLYLVGKALTEPMFGLHSNREMYWFWVKPRVSTVYYGRYDGPGAERFAIRPDYLLQTLGVFPVPEDLTVFRRADDRDVLQTIGVDVAEPACRQGPDEARLAVFLTQEVYLDRTEHHDPVEVRRYDRRGTPIVVTRLEEYRQVDGLRVPARLQYHFVPADATFTLSLRKISLTRDIPETAFTYREPDVEHREDLDRPAEPGAGLP